MPEVSLAYRVGSPSRSNIIVGASGKVFVHELTFQSVDWVKQIAPPGGGGPCPIS